MDIFEYLNGKGGMMILGLFVVVILLYRKIKENRAFKRPNESKNKETNNK